jgi:hypothetical protein
MFVTDTASLLVLSFCQRAPQDFFPCGVLGTKRKTFRGFHTKKTALITGKMIEEGRRKIRKCNNIIIKLTNTSEGVGKRLFLHQHKRSGNFYLLRAENSLKLHFHSPTPTKLWGKIIEFSSSHVGCVCVCVVRGMIARRRSFQFVKKQTQNVPKTAEKSSQTANLREISSLSTAKGVEFGAVVASKLSESRIGAGKARRKVKSKFFNF